MTADVRPQVGGVTLTRLFVEGAEVADGQQRYQIDAATHPAALDSARKFLAHRAEFPNPDHLLLPGMYVRAAMANEPSTTARSRLRPAPPTLQTVLRSLRRH